MSPLASSYAVISSDALLESVIPQFNLGPIIRCEFWCQGINDSYKITTQNDTFILRIYRHKWRDIAAIQFELEALNYLHQHQLKVAYPIKTKQGDYTVALQSAEGKRFAILTRYIKGSEIDLSDMQQVACYAHHIANLHQKSEGFNSQHQRFKLDVKHLIDEPLKHIQVALRQRQQDWLFIKNYAQQLSIILERALENSHDIGLCHADLATGNAHIHEGSVSSFDYDCCAIGLRSYDLAVFKWAIKQQGKSDKIWQHFLNAYQQKRTVQDNDINIIDALVSIRQIWLMGLHINTAVAKGWINDKYFNQQVTFLRHQAAKYS